MFQIGIEGEKLTQQSVVPVHLDYTFATLSGVTLKNGSTYHVLSFPVDVLGTKGETTMLNFTMHGVSPLVAGVCVEL